MEETKTAEPVNKGMSESERNAMLKQLDVEAKEIEVKLQTPEEPKPTDETKEQEPEKPTEQPATETPAVDTDSQRKAEEVEKDKLKKSISSLETETPKREMNLEELRKRHRELQAPFTKISQEISAVKKEVEPLETKALARDIPQGPISDDFKKKILEGLDKDPVETFLNLVDARTRQIYDSEIMPFKAEWEQSKESRREEKAVGDLDFLIKKGHEWIIDEGLGRFNELLQKRPELKGLPYTDLVRFMDDLPVKPTGQAQPGPKTPILGAYGGTPPLKSQADSNAQSLKSLESQWEIAVTKGRTKDAENLFEKMEELRKR